MVRMAPMACLKGPEPLQSNPSNYRHLQQRPPELVWSQPRCTGDVPSKRSGHSLTIVKSGVAYLFGGAE